MQKLILLSVLIATFVIPVTLARRLTRGASFPAVLRSVLTFVAVYVAALIFIYPRLS